MYILIIYRYSQAFLYRHLKESRNDILRIIFFLVIILFKRVYIGLYFLPILSNTGFPFFCVFYVFCFESNVFNQDL